jgi:hypothetical protein
MTFFYNKTGAIPFIKVKKELQPKDYPAKNTKHSMTLDNKDLKEQTPTREATTKPPRD